MARGERIGLSKTNSVRGSAEGIRPVSYTHLSGTVSPTGLYLPPQTVPNPATVTVSATPATGSAASAFVTVAAPTVLGTAQITVTATAAGGAAHGDGVSLTVQ